MKEFYNKPVNPNMLVEFNRYILEGGFLRTILIDDEIAKRTYVTGVVDEIFEKDIKRRVKIKDVSSFESVRDYIINNFGATTGIKTLTEAYRSISKER